MRLRSVAAPVFEPREYLKPKTNKRICTFDTETDPFEHGASIRPFTCGFYDGETYVDFWGDDCLEQFSQYLSGRSDEKLLIYCHNLGGFDIHFMYDYFDGSPPLIINGRITKLNCLGQEFRDSLKIVPVPLRDFQKDEFDYGKNRRERREDYKEEIRLYQRHDCEYLHTLVTEFHETFGNRITIGNAAINMLQSFYGFHRLNTVQDTNIRDFFFGGRTQCFETGVLDDEWRVYDVNSMYPYVMASYAHPISGNFSRGKYISADTYFVELEAWNNGCLPIRGGDGELDFTCRFGTFFATIHELRAGLETGDVKIKRIISTRDFASTTDFKAFIDHFYWLKVKADNDGDKVRRLFYKLILNNAYGKFAQNPERYEDYQITRGGDVPEPGIYHPTENIGGWRPKYCNGPLTIWSRRDSNRRPNYFNVATGASITGAARAELYRGIRLGDRVAYCDTDSVICRSFHGSMDATAIGQWSLEGTGSRLAIAGKKLYALFDAQGNVVKQASKGARLSGADILRVAEGATIEYKHEVPTFGLDGSVTYLERTIERTGA